MLDLATQERDEIRADGTGLRQTGASCDDLVQHPAVEVTGTEECALCAAEGITGSRCAGAWTATTSPAATPHPGSTPPHTFVSPRIR